MRCPDCTTEVPDNATFCPQCGTRLAESGGAAGSPAQKTASAPPPGPPPASRSPSERLQSVAAGRGGREDVPEQDLWIGGYSPKAMYGSWIGAAVATFAAVVVVAVWQNTGFAWTVVGIVAAVVWSALLLVLVYRRASVSYRLTTQRFFHEKGFLSRTTDRVEVIDIDDITVKQGFIERLLGVGTVIISSSDRTEPELPVAGIDQVKQVADVLDKARRAERQRRGLYIESI